MEREGADKLLRRGEEALAGADWQRARSCFEQARKQEETPEVLDGLSEVAHFEGDYDQAIALKERAFAAYRRQGKRVDAADVARWLAFLHGTFHGNFSVASGWMGRAESLLEGVDECAAHGWLILDRAPFSRDVSERERCAASALTIARRFGDADLEFEALALLGETYVASGRVGEGMKLLDQAMAAVSAGEVTGHGAVGEIYCRLLSACEHAGDVRRAEEWMVGSTAMWSGSTSCAPPARHTTAGSWWRRGVGRKPRGSCSRRSAHSSAGIAATAYTPWSDWRIFVCARGGTRRQSA